MSHSNTIRKALRIVLCAAIVAPATALAHHGSNISYDMDHLWTTKATVVEFKYKNPHPWLTFTRVNEKGETETWTAELVTNPTFLLRAGWTQSRTLDAMKPGTIVELTLGTARVGGFNGCVRTIRNEQGELIVNSGGAGGDAPVAPGEAPARRGGPGGGQ
jgi:Family of unknown function (DUF6152)